MSKKLDEELAQALSHAEQQETPAVVKPAAASSPSKPRTRSIGLLATLLVMVGALVALFLVGFKEAAVYATPVDQLLASKDKLAGRKVRVEGELVPGTLVKRDSPCEYRFQIHGTQAGLPVRYPQCVIPDTFRDVPSGGVQVTVEGTLAQDGNFEASLVMAKCTSKYDPNSHEMKGGAQAGEGPLSLN
ncbi:cytochrome c maturation protein CcmE [Sorangium sp. So ce291]|uniref:cytochrome c maturation protein CcmE n=1 Tax=Sorangium sp. So ce291 TaxID=3133294 RepID=UPI003F5D7080